MWDVAVGSRNPTKVGASVTVFSRLGLARVIDVDVPSGVRVQPIGMAETRAGAENRAYRALETTGARYGVGLEGGVDLLEDGTAWLTGVAAVTDREGRLLWAVGPRLYLPPAVTEAISAGEELGPVMDRLSGVQDSKTGVGAIGWLTGSLVDREQSWVVTLACAVAPLLHPGEYQ